MAWVRILRDWPAGLDLFGSSGGSLICFEKFPEELSGGIEKAVLM